METVFTWVDAVMIIFIFTVMGLVSGKNSYDKKLENEKREANGKL